MTCWLDYALPCYFHCVCQLATVVCRVLNLKTLKVSQHWEVWSTSNDISSIGKWESWATFHVFFSRFYVWIFHVFFRFYVRIFHVKINLDRGCLLGVGYFFPWIADVWEVWDIFFWDHECLRGVACEFLRVILHLRIFTCNFFTWELWREIIWDRGCLLGVGYFFEIADVWEVWGIFFLEIVDVWQVWGIFFWDRRCLWNYLRSWMFVRCRVFFFEITNVW